MLCVCVFEGGAPKYAMNHFVSFWRISNGQNIVKHQNAKSNGNRKEQTHFGSLGPSGPSSEARANGAIAAQNRMQSQFKSPDKGIPNKVTKQKKQMVKELDLIDQRQQEMDQMKQDRIKKGLSVH